MPKRRRKSVRCANCLYEFDGIDNYCPNCGQENHSHHAPLRHLGLELIESVTHFDTKFFTTTKALLTSPGLLTADYIVDRRARYVPPVRLYIFASFLFFLIFPLLSKEDRNVTGGNIRITDGSATTVVSGDTIVTDAFIKQLATRSDVADATVDSLTEANFGDRSWIIQLIFKQSVRTKLGLTSEAELEHSIVKNFGIALFILMPIFALLLKLFYIRKKRLYIEHLIFSLHLHGFTFILLLILAFISRFIFSNEWFGLTVFVIPLIYGIMAMHKVYGGTWRTTILKGLVLFPVYGIVLVAGLLVSLVVSVLLL